MTVLRLVTDEQHSVRVPERPRTTPADIARRAHTAADELVQALLRNDLAVLIAAERRLLAIGLLAGDHANHLENDGAA